MTALKLYRVTPRAGSTRQPQDVVGFRDAIDLARNIAAADHCRVTVRNEADCHDWTVAFRVRGGRRGAYTTVEVTR